MSKFSELLSERMDAKGYSSRGLSLRANELAGDVSGWRPLHADGDGIENWVRPRRSWARRPIRPRYWLQLAAIARVLELDEETTQDFFGAAGWSLDGLRVSTPSEYRWLLDFGQSPLLEGSSAGNNPGTELVPVKGKTNLELSTARGATPAPYQNPDRRQTGVLRYLPRQRSRWLPTAIGAGALISVGLFFLFPRSEPDGTSIELVDTAIDDPSTADANLVEPAAPSDQDQPEPVPAQSPVQPQSTEEQSIQEQTAPSTTEGQSPGLIVEPIGRSCLVDLTVQPFDADYVSGVEPEECPEISVWNQYKDYEGGDLLPWNEAVAQCWAGTPLVRLWIGFNLASNTEGWLGLGSNTGADTFKENRPVEPELRTTPDAKAESIGTFEYDDLNGRAFAIQLDLPESLDPALSRPQGDYHLGGCWQQADRDGGRGLHFFWPVGIEP